MGIQFIKHTLTDGLKSILIGDDYFIRNTVRLYINYSKWLFVYGIRNNSINNIVFCIWSYYINVSF